MTSRSEITFLLNGLPVRVPNCDPCTTLLDYLRESRNLKGTKEGCKEGDCGACTVAIVRLVDGRATVRAVNSCILFLPTLDGCAIFTVEGVASQDGLHPIQQMLVDCHGSQCGFCTPGFVMSLFAADLSGETPNAARLDEILSGNLCRCTGYKPIAEAANRALSRERFEDPRVGETLEMLTQLERSGDLDFEYSCQQRGGLRYSAPTSLGALLSLLESSPEATILAGGTDIGLWITKQHRQLPHIVYVMQIPEMQRIAEAVDSIEIGAAVTYNDARAVLARHIPELDPLVVRIASEPIRNSGTIGGNIANGSPIGDMPPSLIALGARIILASSCGQRVLPVEDFYLEYGKQDRRPGEVLVRIEIPKLASGAHFRTFKISKRFDQDISSVCGAFYAEMREGRISNVRICYGGMAGTPKRARSVEQALEGSDLGSVSLKRAIDAFPSDYQPLSDHRASAEYRLLVAQNLLQKFLAELAGQPVTTLDREYRQ